MPDDGTDPFRPKTDNVEVTTTATITIVPLDDAKMGKLIASLGAKIRALKPNHSDEMAEQMLAAIHDERIIPYWIVLAEKPYYSPRIVACRALGHYKTDEAFETLKKLLKTTSDDVRGSATTLEGDDAGRRRGLRQSRATLGNSWNWHEPASESPATLLDIRQRFLLRSTTVGGAESRPTEDARGTRHHSKDDIRRE